MKKTLDTILSNNKKIFEKEDLKNKLLEKQTKKFLLRDLLERLTFQKEAQFDITSWATRAKYQIKNQEVEASIEKDLGRGDAITFKIRGNNDKYFIIKADKKSETKIIEDTIKCFYNFKANEEENNFMRNFLNS